jgi:hypothetical protein
MAELTARLAAAGTSVTVDSTTGFPADAQFQITLRGEPITVIGVAGTTWTLLRGPEARNHPKGTVVELGETPVLEGRIMGLVDQYGGTVMDSSGFQAGWLDYIATRVYNNDFGQGDLREITAATLEGGGDSKNTYDDSMSESVPYWVVSDESGAGTLQRVVDATAPSGFALRWNGAETAYILQDIPVTPGRNYSVRRSHRWTVGLSTTQDVYGSWRDADHTIIGTGGSLLGGSTSMGTATQATYVDHQGGWTVEAPADARFLRVEVRYTVGSGSVHLARVEVAESTIGLAHINNGFLRIHGPTAGSSVLVSDIVGASHTGTPLFTIRADGTLDWADASLERIAAGVLGVTDEIRRFGEAWVAPTLLGTWVNFGGTLGTVAYRRDANGIVHLKGVAKSGTIGTSIFTLPSGFRPQLDTRFPVVSNSLFGACSISSGGDVVASVGSNTSFSLDSIHFRADN